MRFRALMTSPPSSETPQRRPLWKRILLSLGIALVLAVVVIEVMSHIADAILASKRRDPAFDIKTYQTGFLDGIAYETLEYGSVKRGIEQSGARNIPHPYLGYCLTPNYHTPPGSTQQASHNSLGFRGKETTWEKPAGVFRIVTTGGSSVYGMSEMSDAAVWSQRLEDLLNASGGGQRFEVINVGCNGWTSFEMLINLELRALDFQPDLVIVYEAINDMRAALYRPGGPVTRDNLQWRVPWPVDRPSRIESFLEHSRAYMVWRRYGTDYVSSRSDLGFFAMKNYRPDDRDMYWNYSDGPVPELGFQNYRRNLGNIVTVCTARGAKVLFVTQALPRWHLQSFGRRKFEDSSQEQQDAFERILATQREIATERGVPLFDGGRIVEAAAEKEIADRVAERLRADPNADPKAIEGELKEAVPNKARDLLFFSEVHPNDRGSDLIAHTIHDYLRQSPLVPH